MTYYRTNWEDNKTRVNALALNNLEGKVEEISNTQIPNIKTEVDKKADKSQIDTLVRDINSKVGIDEACYIEEITVEEKRDTISNTTYWLIRVPHKDKNGKIIKLKTGVSEYYESNANTHPNDGYGTNYDTNPKLEKARDFSKRKNATLVVNGGIWGNTGALGDYVVNGKIKASDTGRWNQRPLGIKADNTLIDYPHALTAQQLIDDGCLDVLSGFIPIVHDGAQVSDDIKQLYVPWDDRHPRNFIGQMPNKDIVFVCCSGRLNNENGMTLSDGVRIMKGLGASYAYNLDGGGSVSVVHKGNYINKKVDNSGYTERRLYSFIYFSKDDTDVRSGLAKEIMKTNEFMGELRSLVQDTIMDMFNITDFNAGYARLKAPEGFKLAGIESWEGDTKNTKLVLSSDYLRYWDYNNNKTILNVNGDGDIQTAKGILGMFNTNTVNSTNLDIINQGGIYWATGSAYGVPSSNVSWGIIHFQVNSIARMQLAIPFSINTTTNKLMFRRTSTDNAWYNWAEL